MDSRRLKIPEDFCLVPFLALLLLHSKHSSVIIHGIASLFYS